MKKILRAIARAVPDASLLLGLAAITAGAALISVSAGLITGGVFLIALGVLAGGDDA